MFINFRFELQLLWRQYKNCTFHFAWRNQSKLARDYNWKMFSLETAVVDMGFLYGFVEAWNKNQAIIIIVLIGRDINGRVFLCKRRTVSGPDAFGFDRYEAIRKNAFCVFIEMIIAIIYHKAIFNGEIIKQMGINKHAISGWSERVFSWVLRYVVKSAVHAIRYWLNESGKEMICDIFLYFYYCLTIKKQFRCRERDGDCRGSEIS